MKFLYIPAATSYTTHSIITDAWAIYQVKNLQEFAPLPHLKKANISYSMAVKQC